jgi:hypothetical protein
MPRISDKLAPCHTWRTVARTWHALGRCSKIWPTIVVLLTLIGTNNLFCQSKAASDLRVNVVRVEAGESGNPEVGFGFIIAQRQNTIYAVTANHVIQNEPGSSSSPVVTFFDGSRSSARVIRQKNDHDLALIEAEVPHAFAWERRSLATLRQLKRGTQVWFIGRNQEWYVPVIGGAIESDGADPDSWIEAPMASVSPGSSGGPLVTKTGIIGMTVSGSVNDEKFLSIEYIRRCVASWQLPWDLRDADDFEGTWTGSFDPYALDFGPENGCRWHLSLSDAAIKLEIDANGEVTRGQLRYIYNEKWIDEPGKQCSSDVPPNSDNILTFVSTITVARKVHVAFSGSGTTKPGAIASFDGDLDSDSRSIRGNVTIRRNDLPAQEAPWIWSIKLATSLKRPDQ